MIEFKPIDQFDKGLIYELLCESYARLLEANPDYKHEFEANWQTTDDNLFDDTDSSGNVAISTLAGEPIGFVSWFLEGANVGSIGHNCIAPLHRGKGYGKEQVQMALDELSSEVLIVKVTTANHPFFQPARRMYLACGFSEVGRSRADSYGGLELVHYEHARN